MRADPSELTDVDLVQLALQGRDLGARELIRRYERPIFSLVLRMVGDREAAEELAQDTFIKALNRLDTYRTELKFSSWLFRIANNAAIDHLRRRAPETVSLDGDRRAESLEAAAEGAIQLADEGPSPLEALEASELGATIAEAIAQLRPAYRACVLLRFIEDQSYEEIAVALDLPIGTVKTHLHRAKLELQTLLRPLRPGGSSPSAPL
ncbi:MAG: hypothetical protein RLZZ63_492 [Gemmatimonadota bacterium]